jgi:hypothetical protein
MSKTQIATGGIADSAVTVAKTSGVGITVAEQWHLTSNKTSAGDITANLSLFSSNGAGNINAGMSQSSGIFTFPSTGFWQITYRAQIEEGNQDSNDGIIRPEIYLTTDNSSYNAVARGQEGLSGTIRAEYGASATVSLIFDVTNTTTHKCKFAITSLAANDRLLGASSEMFTSFSFVRLGDT